MEMIRYDGQAPGGRMAIFRCSCGVEKRMRASRVLSGHIKSCGCLSREVVGDRSRVHGHASDAAGRGSGVHSRTYYAWSSMRSRCSNPRNRRFATYGARGISVCDRWRDSFANFLADMGPAPDGLTLDRIDNDRGYEPNNCRWASRAEQARNKTITKLNAVSVALMRHMRKRGSTCLELAHAFGVTNRTVNDVTQRRTWV